MTIKDLNGKRRVIAALVIVFVIMGGVCILLSFRLESLLKSYAEKQATEQAKALAALSAEQFGLEIRDLEGIAAKIPADAEENSAIIDVLICSDEDVRMGILRLDGTALAGNPQSFSDFPGIQNAFRGNSSVCYKEGKGILFTTPIYDGENVKYTLYKLYSDAVLLDKFGISCYGGQGEVAILDGDGQVIVPFSTPKSFTTEYLSREIVKECMSELSEKMNVDTAATVYYNDDKGGHFLFVSEVKQLGIYLTGTVPEAVLTEGVSTITALILWVFGLLVVLFVIGIVYLLSAEEKVRESDALREAKNTAEQANRAKSDFLANMSHEIRTPINAIMGMNEMVLRESKDEEIRKFAVNIQSASKTLLSLINDILDFSKIEAGKMEIIPAPYDTAVFLNDVVNMTAIKAKQKQLELRTDIDPELPSELFGDEVRNRQVIVNILNNAVKYTKQGSVRFSVEGIREENGFTLKMQVSDTGIGIKEEDLKKLFDGFQRLDLEKNRNIEGTGLGLAITNRLVEQMNGRLEVSSRYGKGSVFTVYLPQEVRDNRPLGDFRQRFEDAAKQEGQYRESFSAPEAKVLAVDDNEMNLAVVKALLKKTKVQITTCMSGRECLEIAAKEHFDVILLDHMMPEMDGIETLDRLKHSENKCSEVPVIALTANAIVGAKAEYLKAGFADYLSKPIEGTKLEDMLLRYLPKEKVSPVEEKPAEETAGKSAEETVVGNLIKKETGVRYCANSEEFYREMLESFCEGYDESVENITEAFASEDWKTYTVHVHGLKSTSLTIGGEQLSKAAKELELAGKAYQKSENAEENIAFIREHHSGVMDLYKATVQEAEKMLEE